jgi:prefoldin subunit 5
MPREEKHRETLADRVERLGAQMEAFSKLRESFDMRISMLNERIGELRAMITKVEKNAIETGARVEKTASILEEAQPRIMLTRRKQ